MKYPPFQTFVNFIDKRYRLLLFYTKYLLKIIFHIINFGVLRLTKINFIHEHYFQVPGPVDPLYRKLPTCSEREFNVNSLKTLLRTSRAIPALTSIFTLATAFHKAWESKCNESYGICPELKRMMRKEFVNQFLEPVEYIVAGNEGSGELDQPSRIRAPREVEKLEGNKLALTMYGFDNRDRINFRQVCKRLRNFLW